ncbi:hypothetical protein B0A56_00735 [Flavobacterium columnare NBRC 100251 = ATCC 23463]|nr:hypothetical protein B0A56_00735 [Flavobacterium columnare NBRC 100251 = ATCC 23463]
MPKPKPFIFNDENTENHHGFFIATNGISLARFNDNPVMLSNHINANESVLGHWEGMYTENGMLLGFPVFDIEDEEVQKIVGKVERGHIKGCSMGILFNPEDLSYIGGKVVLTKCELTEVSIVAVPSNKASVQLYKSENEAYSDDEISSLCLSLKENEFEITDNMKKITLSLAVLTALKFDKNTPEVEVDAVEQAVLALQNENTNLKAKNLSLEAKFEAEQETKITGLVELSIKEGRIPATKKEDFINLAKADFNLAKSTLESIPTKANLSASVTPPANSGSVTTKEAFLKLSTAEQLQFKTESPEEYKKLFTKNK